MKSLKSTVAHEYLTIEIPYTQLLQNQSSLLAKNPHHHIQNLMHSTTPFLTSKFLHYHTIKTVPTVINPQPINVLIVNVSCKKVTARNTVMTMLNLSIAATSATFPNCNAR